LIICDKFKHTFSSKQIAEIITEKISRNFDSVNYLIVSDGGEGYLDAINQNLNLNRIYTKTYNPIFDVIDSYFLSDNNKTAFIEYSKTGGLQLIDETKRNPLKTTSYGLGQQISEATKIGVEKIFIGLGGSATNDAGIGMAEALGYHFIYKTDNFKSNFNTTTQIKPTGENLIRIVDIIPPKNIDLLKKIEFFATTDVDNFLLGNHGATFTYARQKGASEKDILYLEKGMVNFVKVVKKSLGVELNKSAGEGAAGGLGAGLHTFLNAKIISGSDFMIDSLKIEENIKNADFIISGEGKIDNTTFNGKIVGKIYNIIKKYNKPYLLICGILDENFDKNDLNIIPLFNHPVDVQTAIKLTPALIENINFNKFFNK